MIFHFDLLASLFSQTLLMALVALVVLHASGAGDDKTPTRRATQRPGPKNADENFVGH